MPGIYAADIQIWVSLKIAQLLGGIEYRSIRQAFVLHARQDVIATAVHHPHHPADLVACKPFGQRLDHRNATGNGGLKPDHPASGFGGQGQIMAVMGQQGLVCSDHIFACGDGGFGCQFGGAFVAAHHFDEHINIVALGQSHRIGFPGIA